MQPSGMVTVTSHATMDGRLECFGYGQRPDIPNPGDLLIVTTNWVRENAKVQEIEFTLRIRGRDMSIFCKAAGDALLLWDDNKHWLQAPSSRLPDTALLDTRSLSAIRRDDQTSTLEAFKQHQARFQS
jgi:hypothetical protein